MEQIRRILEYLDNTIDLDGQILEREHQHKRSVLYQQTFGHREALLNLRAWITRTKAGEIEA